VFILTFLEVMTTERATESIVYSVRIAEGKGDQVSPDGPNLRHRMGRTVMSRAGAPNLS
jgi:hypothetical protein